jgi:hypothetical protein
MKGVQASSSRLDDFDFTSTTPKLTICDVTLKLCRPHQTVKRSFENKTTWILLTSHIWESCKPCAIYFKHNNYTKASFWISLLIVVTMTLGMHQGETPNWLSRLRKLKGHPGCHTSCQSLARVTWGTNRSQHLICLSLGGAGCTEADRAPSLCNITLLMFDQPWSSKDMKKQKRVWLSGGPRILKLGVPRHTPLQYICCKFVKTT